MIHLSYNFDGWVKNNLFIRLTVIKFLGCLTADCWPRYWDPLNNFWTTGATLSQAVHILRRFSFYNQTTPQLLWHRKFRNILSFQASRGLGKNGNELQ